jgi:hypothetical protein
VLARGKRNRGEDGRVLEGTFSRKKVPANSVVKGEVLEIIREKRDGNRSQAMGIRVTK